MNNQPRTSSTGIWFGLLGCRSRDDHPAEPGGDATLLGHVAGIAASGERWEAAANDLMTDNLQLPPCENMAKRPSCSPTDGSESGYAKYPEAVANLDRFTWVLKDLRKTCATYCDAHVPESSIELLGHSVGGVTYRQYAPAVGDALSPPRSRS